MEEHEFQLNFRNMLLAHGYTTDVRPTVVAHSYGCFLAKWLLHRNPYIKLRGAVLTDLRLRRLLVRSVGVLWVLHSEMEPRREVLCWFRAPCTVL